MNLTGHIRHFRSRVDDKLHPYAICVTDDSREPKPIIVEVSPGAITDLSKSARMTEEIAGVAAESGRSCIVLRPTGCGPGSLYQNYGEVDLFEAIDTVANEYDIDWNRISVTGASMGGAATWYLISHYPDYFSAAVPFCGYCDYRLWEKPNGHTFHMQDWEEPSWQSRSAAFLVENLEHTPVWIVHGERDRAVGGGVSIEHSRQMARLMGDHGFPYEYTELPETGHNCRTSEMIRQTVPWLLDQRKEREPTHVSLATYSLRHMSSYWVAIEQLERYGERGLVEAVFDEGGCLTVNSDGVNALSIGPVEGRNGTTIEVDGYNLGHLELGRRQSFHKTGAGLWRASGLGLATQKRPLSSGPMGDIFFDRTILVPGTNGTKEEAEFNRLMAENAGRTFRRGNGGVHRGGIPGENNVDMDIISDIDLDEHQLADNNIILFGNHGSNSILNRFESDLPIYIDGKTIRLATESYTTDSAAVFAIFPHPLNIERYVAVLGGVTPDAIVWASHLGLMLLPDYLVFSRNEVLDWGFFTHDWRGVERSRLRNLSASL